jgi:small basic protein (TIGR04137 family)
MSIHPSLKSSNTMKRHRSVLSRLARVQVLQEKGKLDVEKGSVLGMPKVRHLKMKVRKEKAAAATDAAAAGTEAKPGAAAPAAGAAKPAAEAKPKK